MFIAGQDWRGLQPILWEYGLWRHLPCHSVLKIILCYALGKVAQMNDIKHMQCMEVWGGNRPVDSGVIMPGVDAWVYSQPCANQEAGGDVHYVSTCAGGQVVRMVVADIAGHGAGVAETGANLRLLMRR